MGKRKSLRQIIEPLKNLIDDVRNCEATLDKRSPHTQLSYVRSVFAMIEGTIHCVKELEFAEAYKQGKASIPEFVALKECGIEIKDNGKIRESDKFVPTVNNLRFMSRMFHKIFNKELDLGNGTTSWENFKKAVKIRNRVTHPKESGDLNITQEELKTIKSVNVWFNSIVKEILQTVNTFYQ